MAGSKNNKSTNIDWKKLYDNVDNCQKKIDALKAANDAADKQMLEVYKCFQAKVALRWYSSLTGFLCNNNRWVANWTTKNKKWKEKAVNKAFGSK